MLRTDLLLGDVETASSLYKWKDGELIRVVDKAARAALVYVPDSEERGRRESETTSFVRFPGVPDCIPATASGVGAVALELTGAGDARPLSLVHDLPEPALRAGLVALLGTLRFVHSRGIVHGRIDRSTVLVDPSGRFWIACWADARAASDAQPAAGVLGDVSADLRDLARAFREALLRRPWPDPLGARVHERDPRTPAGQELLDAGVRVDRDFARVLSRLVADDPREAYTGATDVLADVGPVESNAFDPWESVAPIDVRRDLEKVLHLLDDTALPASETVVHAASVEFIGGAGAGKSRMLAEIARAARARDVIVLTAEGGAGGEWGGVGSLAMQLAQLVGPRGRVRARHEDALRRMIGAAQEAPRVGATPPEAPGVDGRDSLAAQCTTALTDLVRIAFRRTPGLLLLDDEDRLPAAARKVWRSTGQFVQAVNGAGGALRALLVSTTARALPAEVGVDRIVLEMRPWRPRDVSEFLARAFAAPGGAREAGAAVHRITGGWPGDVVAYLRELERRGDLAREGLRWAPAAPLSSLPALAGGAADHVRRALDAAGRDAVALVECLAVARDVRLSRATLGELCGLPGPRLAAAADAAAACGLLVVDGASWRVRTDAGRHKVCAAIPDERRRVLHREILAHLLDASPDAVDAIATHARAGADPRAAAWTRRAVERARSAGDWEAALRHVEDAASSLGSAFAGPHANLERGELLAHTGRLAEAMETIESVLANLPAADALQGRARLVFARACYEAREWERILSIVLPGSDARGEELSEMRYVRAAAFAHLNRMSESRREFRLAGAELDVAEPVPVALARLECEYQVALYSMDLVRVREALLRKLRIDVQLEHRHRFILDLAKLANAQRALGGNSTEAKAMLTRAASLCRSTPGVSGMTRVILHNAMGFVINDSSRHRRRHFARAHQRALQVGLGPYVSAVRLRLIASSAQAGRCNYSDKQFVRRYMTGVDAISLTELSATAVELAICEMYYGFQVELERLATRCMDVNVYTIGTNNVKGYAIVGRILFEMDVASLIEDYPNDECAAVAYIHDNMSIFLTRDHENAIIAHLAMTGAWSGQRWPQEWTVSELVKRVQNRHNRGWGAVLLALYIALWIPVPIDKDQWHILNEVVRSCPSPLPVGLEWQRLLLESRRLRREGDWRQAEKVKESAERQLALLLRPEHGEPGRRAHERWRARLDAQNQAASVPPPSFAQAAPGWTPPTSDDVAESIREWDAAASEIDGTGAFVVCSPHRRELEFFSARALPSGRPENRRWRACAPAEIVKPPAGCRVILEFPNLWGRDLIQRAAWCLAADGATDRLVTFLTVPLAEFRERGPEERALSELVDGRIVSLAAVCDDASRRGRLFARIVRSFGPGARLDDDVESEVGSYSWPGGLAEMEGVAKAALARDATAVSKRTLFAIGWAERVADRDEGMTDVERRILDVVRGAANSVGVSELAVGAGRPPRTVVRHVAGLVAAGRLVRLGRGRATRYRLPKQAGSAHG